MPRKKKLVKVEPRRMSKVRTNPGDPVVEICLDLDTRETFVTHTLHGQGPAGDKAADESITRRQQLLEHARGRIMEIVGKLPPAKRAKVTGEIRTAIEGAFHLGQDCAATIKWAYHGQRRTGPRADTVKKQKAILQALDEMPKMTIEAKIWKLADTNHNNWTVAEIRHAKYPAKPKRRRRPK